MSEQTRLFSEKEKVFGILRDNPPWPARVVNNVNRTEDVSNLRYRLIFYGTKETAVVSAKDMWSYIDHKHIYGDSKILGMADAMKEAEMAMTNVELELLKIKTEANKTGVVAIAKKPRVCITMEDIFPVTLTCTNCNKTGAHNVEPYNIKDENDNAITLPASNVVIITMNNEDKNIINNKVPTANCDENEENVTPIDISLPSCSDVNKETDNKKTYKRPSSLIRSNIKRFKANDQPVVVKINNTDEPKFRSTYVLDKKNVNFLFKPEIKVEIAKCNSKRNCTKNKPLGIINKLPELTNVSDKKIITKPHNIINSITNDKIRLELDDFLKFRFCEMNYEIPLKLNLPTCRDQKAADIWSSCINTFASIIKIRILLNKMKYNSSILYYLVHFTKHLVNKVPGITSTTLNTDLKLSDKIPEKPQSESEINSEIAEMVLDHIDAIDKIAEYFKDEADLLNYALQLQYYIISTSLIVIPDIIDILNSINLLCPGNNLTLLKYPFIINIIHTAMTYKGEFKFDPRESIQEQCAFQNNCCIIRTVARLILRKFQLLFNDARDTKPFIGYFQKMVTEFKEKTKELSENEKFLLFEYE